MLSQLTRFFKPWFKNESRKSNEKLRLRIVSLYLHSQLCPVTILIRWSRKVERRRPNHSTNDSSTSCHRLPRCWPSHWQCLLTCPKTSSTKSTDGVTERAMFNRTVLQRNWGRKCWSTGLKGLTWLGACLFGLKTSIGMALKTPLAVTSMGKHTIILVKELVENSITDIAVLVGYEA